MAIKIPFAQGPPLKTPVTDRDHMLGPPTAAVELVEYGDYQCPHCKAAYPVVQRLLEELGDKLRYVFRNFPLMRIHPRAKLAAEAAEAAAAGGKFWEMHALLFDHQKELEPEHMAKYAEQLGLDVEGFRQDLSAGAYSARVREDLASGVRSGVNGTPTFFINGRRHNGSFDYDALKAAIDQALNGPAEAAPR